MVLDEQTLHEIYLQPFADAIDAGVASVMCSYNTVSVVAATPQAGGTPGPYSCGNPATLTGILRGELGFKGFTTSDWGANHATSFINDGLDMEMPGTGFGDILPTYFSAADLKAAISAGTVSMATINAAVGHILYEMDRFGLLSGHSKHNPTPEPVNADEQVVQQTAQDAATLLKNDASALPLSHADLGDPVAMPWLGSVKAVLQMWYPGDTGGYATANVLLGSTDPAGRLPFTWPAALDQGVANQPATHPERTSNGVDATGKFCTTPGSPFGGPQCTTTYTEGIYVGYRWYDQQHLTPLYPFGYGLSYTHFGYSGLHWAPARDGGLDVAFRVTNTGSVIGDEVPQVYLGAPASGPAGAAFADRALAAYSRITLRPGQSQVVSLHVPLRQLQYWDTGAARWVTVTGQRPLFVASNERSTGLTTTITVRGGGH